MKKDKTLQKDKARHKAYLLKVQASGELQEMPLMYEQLQDRSFHNVIGNIPVNFVTATRTIRTSDLIGLYAIGDKVKFGDCTMTIARITEEADEAFAMWTNGGYSVYAVVINLQGGGGKI